MTDRPEFPIPENKLTVLKSPLYEEIVRFIKNYNGLPIECEQKLWTVFQQVTYHRAIAGIPKILKQFEEKCSGNDEYNSRLMVQMATNYRIPPVSLCRLMLNEKYKNKSKSDIVQMLKYPHKIPDEALAANVKMCTFNDYQEGPIVDIIRRCVGEEYELRLKALATEAGMTFCDETELRRTGYDKTPDLKLALPCLYKGTVIYWIESKALFGDVRTHRKYLREQLTSYCNRFGAGMVIYWFGYFEDILYEPDNGDNLVITHDFPKQEELEFLKMS